MAIENFSLAFPGCGETGNSHTWRIHAKSSYPTNGWPDSLASSALVTNVSIGSKHR